MNTELVTMDAGGLSRLSEPEQTPMDLMRLAIEGKCDVGTLERLTALEEKFQARRAKQAFDDALAAFQSECPILLKTVPGAQGKYKFTPFDHIVAQVKPLLQKHGFNYRTTSESHELRLKVTIHIRHKLGHSEESSFEVPVDQTKTRDGAALMSQPQYFGAALTFATRRAFCNAFGILTADEDRDGQMPQAKQGLKALRGTVEAKVEKPTTTPDPEPDIKKAKAELWSVLKTIRGPENNWVQAQQWLVDECLMDPDDTINTLSAMALRAIAAKAKGKL